MRERVRIWRAQRRGRTVATAQQPRRPARWYRVDAWVGGFVRALAHGLRDLSVPWDVGPAARPGAVTVDRAITLAPVYAAVRVLASNIAGLPIQAFRKTGEIRDPVPLPSLFVQPSVQGVLHDWLWRAVTSLAYWGNAVGLITETDYYGFPTGVEWINPEWVQCTDTMASGPGSFTRPIWRILGQEVPAESLVHIPWFTLPGRVWGLSPVGAFAATIGTGLAAQDYTRDWFENGGVPPATYQNTTQTISQNEAKLIKKRLRAAIRSREPIVYGKDWKFDAIKLPEHEAKFIETMKLSATQIAAIYGVPAEMIGGEAGGHDTYSSPEQRIIELDQFALLPWLTKLESHFSRLMPRPQYVKFNADAVIRVDIETRWAVYEKARLIGAMNVDEIRAKEDMPPLPNGQGQDYTPLPLAAGAQVSVPAVRGADRLLKVVGGRDTDHG